MAKYHNIPQPTISNIIRRIKANKIRTEVQKPKRGRPSKLDSLGIIRLEELLINNRFLPKHKILALFNENCSVNISMRTLQKFIAKIGFKAVVAIQKPYIRDANLVKRTSRALRHVHWNMNAWSHVLFTDETHFAVKPIKNNSKV